MEKRINLFGLLRAEGKLTKILLYMAQEVENDPYEKTRSLNYQQPIAIDALVRDVSPEALTWKYFGTMPMGSKELCIEKKHKNTIKTADRIKIGDDFFKVYKDDSKGFSVIERQDYLVVVVALKPINE
jgi:hypothetical protein